MSHTLEFPTLPPMRLLPAVLRWRRPTAGSALPRIEARCLRSEGGPDQARWLSCCGAARALPIWPQVLAGPLHLAILSHAAFPFPVAGLVHLGNRFEQRAPSSGKGLSGPLALRAWAEGFVIGPSGAEITLHTEARPAGSDPDSPAPWASTMTVLSRSIRGRGERAAQQQEPAWPAARSVVWSVPADQGRRYAAVSGDHNPIHTSPLLARLFGFPRAIAHGMWTLGRALSELDSDLPARCALEVRFRSPLLLPSRVRFEGGREGAGGRFRVWTEKKTILSAGWQAL